MGLREAGVQHSLPFHLMKYTKVGWRVRMPFIGLRMLYKPSNKTLWLELSSRMNMCDSIDDVV